MAAAEKEEEGMMVVVVVVVANSKWRMLEKHGGPGVSVIFKFIYFS